MKAFLNYIEAIGIAAKYYFLNEKITDSVVRQWVDELCERFGIEIECRGTFHDRRFVLLANHESFFDIPALYKCCSTHLIWVAKKELFNVPLIGHALRDLGGVAIDRSDELKSARAMLRLMKEFREGGIVIFPSGSRIKKNTFHKGGVFLARRKNIPVYPVKIEGTQGIVPIGKMALFPGKVTVQVFDKVNPDDFSEGELVELVRSKIGD
jgi:1-acyl-sn-glycerol-3-phosphate acyltransferase